MTAAITLEPLQETSAEISIRPFDSQDYERVVEIYNTNFPEYRDTADEWRFQDEKRDPKFRFARFVAEDPSGQIVGFAGYEQHSWMYHPRKFELNVNVAPEHQGRGLGQALYNHVLKMLEPFDPLTLRTHVREDMARGVAFIARQGYTEEMRDWESRLNVAACDLGAFAQAAERVQSQGILIRTLRELEADPERDRKLYELETAISRDMPSSDTPTTPDFDDWRRHTFENPNLLSDAYFIAVDTTAGDRYVGLSQLWKSQASDDLFTGATGVFREYRRRGIALALKLRAVAYAKSVECETIRTWNAQSNRAMLSINEALGFVKQPAWVSYGRELQPENAIVIRPFTPEDYEALAAIHNAVFPDYPETAAEWRWNDEHRDPKCKWGRFVAERDGQVVGFGGYGQWSGMYHPRKFGVDVNVHPEHRGAGVGTELYKTILSALEPFDPIALHTEVRADHESGIRFAQARDFVEVMREQESRIDLTAFEPAQYAEEVAAVEAQGIALKTVAELRETDPDWKRNLYELSWTLHQDVPHSDEPTKPDFEVWCERLNNPNFLPEGNFVAVDTATGEYAGTSTLWNSQSGGDLHTGLTGIVRAYRKRGIATALKVRALSYAKSVGVGAVRTWNEVNNNGMLGINFRLGFVRQPAWLQMTRTIKSEE